MKIVVFNWSRDIKVILFLTLMGFTLSFPTFGQDRSSHFPGFRSDHYGIGGHLGWPIGIRYHRWQNWKRAMFFDLGYQIDKFAMVGANYAFYLLDEDDRWKMSYRVGTILNSVFIGMTAGLHTGDDPDEKARLGVRAGGAFEYLIPKSSWSIKVELAPVLFLSGKEAAGIQGGFIFIHYFDAKTGKGFRQSQPKARVPRKSRLDKRKKKYRKKRRLTH